MVWLNHPRRWILLFGDLWLRLLKLDAIGSEILCSHKSARFSFFGIHSSSWQTSLLLSVPESRISGFPQWKYIIYDFQATAIHVWRFGAVQLLFLSGLNYKPLKNLRELMELIPINPLNKKRKLILKIHKWARTLKLLTLMIAMHCSDSLWLPETQNIFWKGRFWLLFCSCLPSSS